MYPSLAVVRPNPADEAEQPALMAVKDTEKYQPTVDDPERAEYFVLLHWLDTVPQSSAFNEGCLSGNLNTVCQPTTPDGGRAATGVPA